MFFIYLFVCLFIFSLTYPYLLPILRGAPGHACGEQLPNSHWGAPLLTAGNAGWENAQNLCKIFQNKRTVQFAGSVGPAVTFFANGVPSLQTRSCANVSLLPLSVCPCWRSSAQQCPQAGLSQHKSLMTRPSASKENPVSPTSWGPRLISDSLCLQNAVL